MPWSHRRSLQTTRSQRTRRESCVNSACCQTPPKEQWQFRHGLWLHMTVMNMIRARTYNISNFTFIFLWISIDFPQPPSNITSVKSLVETKSLACWLLLAWQSKHASHELSLPIHPIRFLSPWNPWWISKCQCRRSWRWNLEIQSIERSILLFFVSPIFSNNYIHYIHQNIFLVHPCVLQLKVNSNPWFHPCPNSVKARGFTSHVAAVAASGKTVGGLVQQLPQSLGDLRGNES